MTTEMDTWSLGPKPETSRSRLGDSSFGVALLSVMALGLTITVPDLALASLPSAVICAITAIVLGSVSGWRTTKGTPGRRFAAVGMATGVISLTAALAIAVAVIVVFSTVACI